MHKLDHSLTVLGRSIDSNVRLIDDGISRHHCRIRVEGGQVVVEDLASRNGTFCNGERLSHHVLQDGDKLQLGKTTILKFSYHDHLEESFQKQMLESALRDGLTGTYNKRYFLDRLDSEIKFSLRHKVNLALLMMDLDKFKDVNDTQWSSRWRQGAFDIRQDGAEEHPQRGRLCALWRRGVCDHHSGNFRAPTYTTSPIGYGTKHLSSSSTPTEFEYPSRLVWALPRFPKTPLQRRLSSSKAADDMLYEAKRGGRNRVIITPH